MIRVAITMMCLVFGVAGLALPVADPAQADNFTFYSNSNRDAPWSGPSCDEAAVLNRITAQFDQAEAQYWHTGIRMAQITQPRETAFRDWDPKIIATRYCSGTAYLSNGKRYGLVYWLRSEQGFAGVGWGVQFCLVGRDRDYAYAPHCRNLRPI